MDTLGALGKPVLISNFLRYHRLVTYLSRHTQKPIGLPIGLVRLRDVMDEKFYTDLPGGLMESLGQLFKNGAKLYVYPSLDKKTGKLFTVENLEVAPHLRHLYAHLVENKFIDNITTFNPETLRIYSGEVLAKIHSGDDPWHKSSRRKSSKSSRPKNFSAGARKPRLPKSPKSPSRRSNYKIKSLKPPLQIACLSLSLVWFVTGCVTERGEQTIFPVWNLSGDGQLISNTNVVSGATYELHVYIVRRGDTLAMIARRFHVSLTSIEAFNPGLDPRHLYVGMKLLLAERGVK